MKGEGGSSSSSPAPAKRPSVTLPQGKWSERVEQASGALTIKSFYNSDTVVPVPFAKPPGMNKYDQAMLDSSCQIKCNGKRENGIECN